MAIIYVVDLSDNNRLKTLHQVVNDTLTHDNFKVFHKSIWNDEDFNEIKSRSAGYDTVHIKEKIVMEPHTHTDNEDRLILAGIGHFFIPAGDLMFIIKATEGDFVSLQKDLVHWFSCKKGLVAARFFENEKSYKVVMKNIPHEIYRLKDDFEDLRNVQI